MQKLPVFLTLKHALNAAVHFRSAGIRIALPWTLALAAFGTLNLILFGAADLASTGNEISIRPTDMIFDALSMVAFSSIAVNWHRYILLDEVPTPERIFRLDLPVWKYIGRTLLILIAVIVPVIVVVVVVTAVNPNTRNLFSFPLFVAGVYFMRMSVALPAAALGRKDFGIKDALKTTEGNNWQFAGLFALNILILLGAFLALNLILAMVANINLTAVKICAVVLSIPANLFLVLFSVSLLSSLYGFFAEGRKF